MPRQPKKPADVWESHKQHIYDYYVIQNQSLGNTMQLMQTNHKFDATKREYIRRLELWQFSKNLKKIEWQLVYRRKLLHKETEIHLNGQRVNQEKQKRGLARHKTQPQAFFEATAPTPLSTRGLVLRTPSPEPRIKIYVSSIPWFQFQDSFNCRLLSAIHEFIPTLNWDNLSDSPLIYYSNADISLQNARSLLRKLIDLPGNDYSDFVSLILGRLEKTLPSKSSMHHHLVSKEPFFLLIQFCIYQCANNNMGLFNMDKFLSWMLDSGILPFFGKFLDQQRREYNPTTEVFLIRLLISAINLEVEDLVSFLLIFGIDPNCNNNVYEASRFEINDVFYPVLFGLDGTITPLQMAVIQGNVHICKLLLRHGANPNAVSPNMPITPLELAISAKQGDFQIAQVLVESNADTHLFHDFEVYKIDRYEEWAEIYTLFARKLPQKTLLMKTIEVQNINIARMLLENGAPVNNVSFISGSALRLAATKNDLEMVELLLQEEAQVNMFDALENSAKAFFDHTFERACKFSAKGHKEGWKSVILYHFACVDWGAFVSPIQIATRRNNHHMVQRLLEAGAIVSHATNWSRIWGKIPTLTFKSEEFDIYQYMMSSSRERFQTILHESVGNGNIDLTRLLLQQGANKLVNHPNGLGMTPLQLACGLKEDALEQRHRKSGLDVFETRMRLANLLIAFNANLDSSHSSENGKTALQIAAEIGDCELVEFLIDSGAQIETDTSPENWSTLLEAAAMSGKPSMLACFLSWGAQISRDIYWIGLYAAASNGDSLAVEQFLKQGVSINAVQSERNLPQVRGTILEAAARSGDFEVIQMVLDAGADVNQVSQGDTVLCTAAREGNLALIDKLLMHGANPNHLDANFTPLAIAAWSNAFYMTKKLLQAGADVNQPSGGMEGEDKYGPDAAPPLYWVVAKVAKAYLRKEKGEQESILERIGSLLLCHGADPDTRSVLSMACWCMSDSFVEKLINRGANVNIPLHDKSTRHSSGMYPIQVAVAHSRQTVVRLLLEAGADVNQSASQNGLRALDFAFGVYKSIVSEERKEIIRLLTGAGARCNDEPSILFHAIYNGVDDLALDLIKSGADVNYRSGPSCGSRPLQAAVVRGNIDVVQLLLDHGAHIHIPPSFQEVTALQLAATEGNFNIVKLLIERGAEINAAAPPNIEGGGNWIKGTALQSGARHGHMDVSCLLLENDKEIDMIKSRCKEAAKIAEDEGHHVLARILRNYQPGC